ncbi:MAG TPA: TRAP transporter TatT component family protein [Vicinamibacterales bacterium]|nr:TRAP transporter TatT component family protein [Vicinamibacterales bacterium]
MTRTVRGVASLSLFTCVVVASAGCSIRRMALNSVASSLSSSGDTFASDEDPELIRHAVPFSLKLVESLLAELPEHRGLLLTACSGFTQYGYAFVDLDAELLKLDEYSRSEKLRERARRLYLRARDYCVRSLELRYPGIRAALARDAAGALAPARKEDVALLYWTGAAWGKAVSLSLDRPELAGDLPIVQALIRRALQLDETFGDGALHEVMITIEAVPEAMGGSPERARQHFEQAVALSNGTAAGPYVSFATGVLLPQQKRDEFIEHLNKALQIDVNARPSLRLANTLAQQHARYLLDRVDDLFLSGSPAQIEVLAMMHAWPGSFRDPLKNPAASPETRKRN